MYSNEKIKLRGFRKEDAPKLVELREDFDAVRSFAGSPFPVNQQTEEEWISNMYPPGLKTNIFFAIEEISSGNMIGYCVARKTDYINRNAEVGIMLFANGRGKGYFKEVSALFYSYLFNELNLHKVYSYVLIDNTVAIETDKKIGFVVEGQIKEHIYQGGTYKDVYFVSLYANAFPLRIK
jgi:RimJ/RimL family protein N-acetyltransferase